MSERDHWEKIYSSHVVNRLGWYRAHLETSFEWIGELGLSRGDPIIDVGGGASRLADALLDRGYQSVTVLDLSRTALARTRERLGEGADRVIWLEGSVTSVRLPLHHYGL